MLKFIDTHAHLTDEKYDDINMIKKHWEGNFVSNVFAVSYNIDTAIKSIKIANEMESVYAIIGIHPDELSDYTKENLEKLKELAKDDKVIAIGEIGLDYHFIDKDDMQSKKLQRELFEAQIKLADELKLPIMIHVRDAIGDLISVLKDNSKYLNNGGVIHCFSESVESFEILKNMGFVIGVGGVVTFKNGKKLQEVVTKCNISDIILETDCPYLAPEPYRGTVNSPSNIPIIAEKIAELKGMKIEDVASEVFKNVKRVFAKFRG